MKADANSKGRSLSPRTWRWLRRAHWLVIPVLALTVCEMLVRKHASLKPRWYQEAAYEALDHPIDYIFVGSSRVGAAIDVPAFTNIMTKRLGRPVNALNMGRGYSMPAEHYFGLRYLFQVASNHMEGCVVFWEAPGRVFHLGSWKDAWVYPDQPKLILPLLRADDLPGFWQSEARTETKLELTMEVLLRPLALFSRRERFRERVLMKGESIIGRALDHIRSAPAINALADLSTNGGIRTDEAAVQRARALAVTIGEQRVQLQSPFRNWDSPLYRDLHKLVEEHHGKIVLFDMPESSTFSREYKTDIGRRNQQSFEQHFGSLHTVLLRPAFSYNDNDFPDLWHLRKSRAAEFTAALAESYLQTVTPTKTVP